jgi:hypothetical protein
MAARERFIAEVLKPRFLPQIEPASFNYAVDLHGKWHGNTYHFIQRFNTDHSDGSEPEIDEPLARLAYVGPDRFDLSCNRHTGAWSCLYQCVLLAEALSGILTALSQPQPGSNSIPYLEDGTARTLE